MSNRSVVYIDGFNFYYGAVKGTLFKWLDIQKYFLKLRPDDDIQKIWYFTAKVSGGQRARQKIYFDALSNSPLIELVFGLYKQKNLRCRVESCRHRGSRVYSVPEEKGTDVNIAIQMVDDAYRGVCDRMILVSGDSDLVPAVNLVKARHPHIQITIYVPARHPSRGAARELRNAGDKDKSLPTALFPETQFPQTVMGASGRTLYKPAKW